MLFKIIVLFFVFIAVLGFFGKMHWLGGKRFKQTKCADCGRHRIGSSPCPCRKKG